MSADAQDMRRDPPTPDEGVGAEEREDTLASSPPDALAPAGLTLEVAQLGMAAQLRRTPSADPPTLADVHALLELEGVVSGLVPDEEIAAWLEAGGDELLVVAQGVSPVPGEDARLHLQIELDPVAVGVKSESGRIDFNERGQIPVVQEGDVLLTKEPPKPGTDGVNVWGTRLSAERGQDVRLLPGANVRVGEDGLSVVATAAGTPKRTSDGRLSVAPVLVIEGDVGAHTGNVRFDGEVRVTGMVRPGFSVRSEGLAVGEIDHAEVEVEGDLKVAGSIIGAAVRAGGTIRARAVRRSEVRAAGNVVVAREVADSRVETGGRLQALEGRIVGSKVIARQGVAAGQIGSTRSEPCHLSVGIDPFVAERVEPLRAELETLQQERQTTREQAQQAETALRTLTGEIGKRGDNQAAVTAQLRKVQATVVAAGETHPSLPALKAVGTVLHQRKVTGDEQLDALRRAEDTLREQLVSAMKGLKRKATRIRELEEELVVIRKATPEDERRTGVWAKKAIHARTRIKSPRAGLELKRDHGAVVIRERRAGTEEDPSWHLALMTR